MAVPQLKFDDEPQLKFDGAAAAAIGGGPTLKFDDEPRLKFQDGGLLGKEVSVGQIETDLANTGGPALDLKLPPLPDERPGLPEDWHRRDVAPEIAARERRRVETGIRQALRQPVVTPIEPDTAKMFAEAARADIGKGPGAATWATLARDPVVGEIAGLMNRANLLVSPERREAVTRSIDLAKYLPQETIPEKAAGLATQAGLVLSKAGVATPLSAAGTAASGLRAGTAAASALHAGLTGAQIGLADEVARQLEAGRLDLKVLAGEPARAGAAFAAAGGAAGKPASLAQRLGSAPARQAVALAVADQVLAGQEPTAERTLELALQNYLTFAGLEGLGLGVRSAERAARPVARRALSKDLVAELSSQQVAESLVALETGRRAGTLTAEQHTLYGLLRDALEQARSAGVTAATGVRVAGRAPRAGVPGWLKEYLEIVERPETATVVGSRSTTARPRESRSGEEGAQPSPGGLREGLGGRALTTAAAGKGRAPEATPAPTKPIGGWDEVSQQFIPTLKAALAVPTFGQDKEGRALLTRAAVVRNLVEKNAPNALDEAKKLDEALREHLERTGAAAPPVSEEEKSRRYFVETRGNLVELRDRMSSKPLKVVPLGESKLVSDLTRQAEERNAAATFDDVAMTLLSPEEMQGIGEAESTTSMTRSHVKGGENAIVGAARQRAIDVLRSTGVAAVGDKEADLVLRAPAEDTRTSLSARGKLAPFLRKAIANSQSAIAESQWREMYQRMVQQHGPDEADWPEAVQGALAEAERGIPAATIESARAEAKKGAPAPPQEEAIARVERKLDDLAETISAIKPGPSAKVEVSPPSSTTPPMTAPTATPARQEAAAAPVASSVGTPVATQVPTIGQPKTARTAVSPGPVPEAISEPRESRDESEVFPKTETPAQPSSAKPTEGRPSPLTKSQQQSAQRIRWAADNIEVTGAAERKGRSQARKKDMEGFYSTLRTHGPKLGIEVPSVGTLYAPEAYVEAARTVRTALDALAGATGALAPPEEVSRQQAEFLDRLGRELERSGGEGAAQRLLAGEKDVVWLPNTRAIPASVSARDVVVTPYERGVFLTRRGGPVSEDDVLSAVANGKIGDLLGEPTRTDSGRRQRKIAGARRGAAAVVRETGAEYATETAATFFSQLDRTIEEKMPNAASADQVLGIVRNPQNRVKADELKWSGIERWLATKSTKVTKAEVLEFLLQNSVRVEEVVKGGDVSDAYEAQHQAVKNAVETLQRLDFLGFETAGEALVAVRDHADYATRWDLTGDAEAVRVLDDFRTADTRLRSAPTKFQKYVLPGGANYRELLLTLLNPLEESGSVVEFAGTPGQVESARRNAAVFTGGHFDEPNVLAHLRFNERVDTDGRRVLLIEEIQSDWHQTGRQEGYVEPISETDQARLRAEIVRLTQAIRNAPTVVKVRELERERTDVFRSLSGGPGVPPAPFAKTWHELVLKRMLRWAAENGFDKLAWTTGEQQAARYDLSKQVDEIHWQKLDGGDVALEVVIGGEDANARLGMPSRVSAADVARYIGKDAAKKIAEASTSTGSLKGPDLKVGGHGMQGFYDKIVPDFMNRYGKQWGSRVGETRIVLAGDKTQSVNFATGDYDQAVVHSIDITPAMRESVLRRGQALFEPGEELTGAPEAGQTKSREQSTGKQLEFGQLEAHRKVAPAISTKAILASLRTLPQPGKPQGTGKRVAPAGWNVGDLRAIARAAGITHGFWSTVNRIEFVRGRIPWQGLKLATQADVEAAAGLIRNRDHEGLHLVGTDADGNVVHYNLWKGGRNYVEVSDEELDAHLEKMTGRGATGVRMLHNHPGGNPKPSIEDVDFTKRLAKAAAKHGLEFIEHDVTDDLEYGHIDADGNVTIRRWEKAPPNAPGELARPSSLLEVRGAVDAVRLLKGVFDARQPVLVALHLNANLRLSGMSSRPVSSIAELATFGAALGDEQDASGATHTVLVTNFDPQWDDVQDAMREVTASINSAAAERQITSNAVAGLIAVREGGKWTAIKAPGTVREELQEFGGTERPPRSQAGAPVPAKKGSKSAGQIQREAESEEAKRWLEEHKQGGDKGAGVREDVNEFGLQDETPLLGSPEKVPSRSEAGAAIGDAIGEEAAAMEAEIQAAISEGGVIPPWWKRVATFQMIRKSAVDTLRLGGGELKNVATAYETYADDLEGLTASTWKPFDELVRSWDRPTRKRAWDEFEDYMLLRETAKNPSPDSDKMLAERGLSNRTADDLYQAASPETRSLIDATRNLFTVTGDANQKLGVKVFEQGTKTWRPIGSFGSEYWPRVLRKEIRKVIDNPAQYAEQHKVLLAEVMRKLGTTSAQVALEHIASSLGYKTAVGNDFMSNLEMARAKGLPQHWYEHRFERAVPHFVAGWGRRFSQIKNFGQAADDGQDLFDHVLEKVHDRETENYLKKFRNAVYEVREPHSAIEKAMQIGRAWSVATKLANWWSALRNLSTVPVNLISEFGVRASVSEVVALHRLGRNIRDARAAGVLRSDLLRGMAEARDYTEAQGKVLGVATTVGGFSLTEMFNRTVSASIARNWARWALQRIEAQPKSRSAVLSKAKFKKLGVDPEALKAQGEDGPEWQKLMRAASNNTQFPYDLRSLALWTQTPSAKFLFQFQTFGMQQVRRIEQDVLRPTFYGYYGDGEPAKEPFWKSPGQRRTLDFGKLLFFLAATVGTGAAFLWLRYALFRKRRPDASLTEIGNTWDKDKGRATHLAFSRLMHDLTYVGALGTFGDYSESIARIDPSARLRGTAFVTPPAWSTVQNAWDALVTRLYQQRRLTLDDLARWARNEFPLFNYGTELGKRVGGSVARTWPPADLQQRRSDVVAIRRLGQRYADEMQMERTRSGGDMMRSPRSPAYDELQEALLLGDVARAQKIKDGFLVDAANPDEAKRRLGALRTVINARRPVKVGGLETDDQQQFRTEFRDWVGEREPSMLPRLIEIERQYFDTAEAIGLSPGLDAADLRGAVGPLKDKYGIDALLREAVVQVAGRRSGLGHDRASAAFDRIATRQAASPPARTDEVLLRAVLSGNPPPQVEARLDKKGVDAEQKQKFWASMVDDLGKQLQAQNKTLGLEVQRALTDTSVPLERRQQNVRTLRKAALVDYLQRRTGTGLAAKLAATPSVDEVIAEAKRGK